MDKALMALAAAAAIAAAAAVSVVSAAFALYALVQPFLGAAGAGAAVAAVFALIVAVAGLLARRKVERPAAAAHQPDAGLVQKVMEIAKERPMLAVGAAIAAGVYAIRHPSLVAAIIGAVVESRSRKD